MIAALFVRADSHYKAMPDVDAWDMARDARGWPGGCPAVAHPPCRAWGRMRDKARPRADEMELARQAVRWVRQFGGVLEHPAHSTLWADMGMCKPRRGSQRGQRDAWGGWTLPISQHWFGYRAEKLTWLYVVGCEPGNVPALPLDLADPPRVVAQLKGRGGKPRPRKGDQGWRPEVTRTERERTPLALAEWLVELARRCDEVPRIVLHPDAVGLSVSHVAAAFNDYGRAEADKRDAARIADAIDAEVSRIAYGGRDA